MVLAIAFESLVKLVAFLAVGTFAIFVLYGPNGRGGRADAMAFSHRRARSATRWQRTS